MPVAWTLFRLPQRMIISKRLLVSCRTVKNRTKPIEFLNNMKVVLQRTGRLWDLKWLPNIRQCWDNCTLYMAWASQRILENFYMYRLRYRCLSQLQCSGFIFCANLRYHIGCKLQITSVEIWRITREGSSLVLMPQGCPAVLWSYSLVNK